MVGCIDDLEKKVIIVIKTVGFAAHGLVLTVRPLKDAVGKMESGKCDDSVKVIL